MVYCVYICCYKTRRNDENSVEEILSKVITQEAKLEIQPCHSNVDRYAAEIKIVKV